MSRTATWDDINCLFGMQYDIVMQKVRKSVAEQFDALVRALEAYKTRLDVCEYQERKHITRSQMHPLQKAFLISETGKKYWKLRMRIEVKISLRRCVLWTALENLEKNFGLQSNDNCIRSWKRRKFGKKRALKVSDGIQCRLPVSSATKVTLNQISPKARTWLFEKILKQS